MPKLKTRKAALKRYKKTGAGNFLRRHAYKGHLLMKKSNVQKPCKFIGLFREVNEFICVFKHFDSQNFKNQWFFDVGFQKPWFLPLHFS